RLRADLRGLIARLGDGVQPRKQIGELCSRHLRTAGGPAGLRLDERRGDRQEKQGEQRREKSPHCTSTDARIRADSQDCPPQVTEWRGCSSGRAKAPSPKLSSCASFDR